MDASVKDKLELHFCPVNRLKLKEYLFFLKQQKEKLKI